MIVHSERPNPPQRRRLWSRFRQSPTAEKGNFLQPEDFELLVQKEIARCERRLQYREFALLTLSMANQLGLPPVSFLNETRRRLRITDEIGIWQDTCCVLLPETDREGAAQVANQLMQLGHEQGLDVDTDIRMFPWDDQIISQSDELSPEHSELDGSRHLTGDRIDPTQHEEDVETLDVARPALMTGNRPIWASLPTPWWKRSIDIVGAGVGLAALSPLLLITALMIRLDSSGPAFFVQRREGKDGRVFKILKFRTMRKDAETKQAELRNQSEQDGPAFKISDDPRVTRIGRYLRKTCIDELPQLINVLKGEMSLVGPRPLPVCESVASKGWQRQRLRVLPGLTCIWQIQGGRHVSFDEWMRMDLEYVERRSFWLDLRIIFRTVGMVLAHRGSV